MNTDYDQYFLSYSSAKLPLLLVGELSPESVKNRNTYYAAKTDAQGRFTVIHKWVSSKIELEHRYGYKDSGALKYAEITYGDEEPQRVEFE